VIRLVLIVPLLLSVALLSLAVSRVAASVLKAPAHRTLLVIESGKSAGAEATSRAATYTQRAAQWEHSAELFGELGFLRLWEGFQTGRDDSVRLSLIDQASQSLRQSIYLSPARPHPWVRLAYASVLEGADPKDTTDLLAQSVRTGPYVAEISVTRLELLLRLWQHLTPEMRRYTMRQIRYIWPNAGHHLLRLARNAPRPDIIRLALRRDPVAVERVDALIARRYQ
jgi:hypothetical protein